MKTVQYDLRIVHRKKVAIGAINRKEIDRILRDMITSGEALNMEGGEIVGIMVEWQYNCTYSGVPQGSGISPICANIYLSELDNYMQECLFKA